MEYIILETLKTILFISAILFVLGLISPKKSLFFLKNGKTRKNSSIIYGGISLAILIILFNIMEIDYYGKGISYLEKEKFEKSIEYFKSVEVQHQNFDSAQYYIQFAKTKILEKDSIIKIKEEERLALLGKEEEKRKKEETRREKKEVENILRLFENFAQKIDERNDEIEKASKQASGFLKNYASNKSTYQQTIQALEMAINVCNTGMISIDNIPTEFNEPLENRCIELLRAYSSAYFERMMIFVNAKEGIEKNNPDSFNSASRFRNSYESKLLKAVALDIELRNEFGLKMPK